MIFGHQEFSKFVCVLEVFYAKEIVMWCIDKFDKNQRIIQLQGESPISLSPSTFKKMFRLPEPMMNFKGDEAKYFSKDKNGGWDLLQQYLEDLTIILEYLSTIQVSLLKYPTKKWHVSLLG
jgi:hypothetical protein